MVGGRGGDEARFTDEGEGLLRLRPRRVERGLPRSVEEALAIHRPVLQHGLERRCVGPGKAVAEVEDALVVSGPEEAGQAFPLLRVDPRELAAARPDRFTVGPVDAEHAESLGVGPDPPGSRVEVFEEEHRIPVASPALAANVARLREELERLRVDLQPRGTEEDLPRVAGVVVAQNSRGSRIQPAHDPTQEVDLPGVRQPMRMERTHRGEVPHGDLRAAGADHLAAPDAIPELELAAFGGRRGSGLRGRADDRVAFDLARSLAHLANQAPELVAERFPEALHFAGREHREGMAVRLIGRRECEDLCDRRVDAAQHLDEGAFDVRMGELQRHAAVRVHDQGRRTIRLQLQGGSPLSQRPDERGHDTLPIVPVVEGQPPGIGDEVRGSEEYVRGFVDQIGGGDVGDAGSYRRQESCERHLVCGGHHGILADTMRPHGPGNTGVPSSPPKHGLRGSNPWRSPPPAPRAPAPPDARRGRALAIPVRTLLTFVLGYAGVANKRGDRQSVRGARGDGPRGERSARGRARHRRARGQRHAHGS